MDSTDKILIIGAGPSGLTLATELTRRGIACVIVDKASGPAPMHESRALAFNARSQAILATSGVAEKIVSAGHVVKRIQLCWQGELRKEVTMLADTGAQKTMSTRDSAAALPGGVIIIRQGAVERILQAQLEVSGVEVQWNTELESFTQTEDSAVALLKLPSGKIEERRVKTIVGCDGAHSQVRQQGGYTFEGESDPQNWTLLDATVKGKDFSHTLIADLRPGSAFATMPIEHNIVRLIHNGPDILQAHPMAKYCEQIHWQSEFRVSYRLVKQYHRGRTFLCGDAAHIHSPVGGRGMNLGIEDAATLAWLLEEGREEQYTNRRLPVARKVLNMTKQQTGQMNASSLSSSMAKKYGPKLLAVPFIRRSMKRSVSGLDTPDPEWLR